MLVGITERNNQSGNDKGQHSTVKAKAKSNSYLTHLNVLQYYFKLKKAIIR